MTGYVDVFTGAAYTLDGKSVDVPAALKAKADDYRGKLMEMVAETDEELMMKFFEGEEFTAEEINRGVHAAIAGDTFIPLMAGNATTCTRVGGLMDKIVDLLPSPAKAKKAKATKDGQAVEVACDASAPFSAQVFKSIVDPYVGKLLILKVKSGKLQSGDTVFNNTAEKPEKIGTIYVLKGKKQEPVDFLEAGDIGALAKLVYTNTNDTLSAPENKLVFDKIEFPAPVISYAVKAAKDEEKVIQGLIKMQDEDATFKVEKNVETGDVLISGLGEAQLDIMCKRVKNKLGLDISWQEPRVAYRETIRKTAEAEGKHKKQSGGAGQYGDVFIKFEPGAEDGEFEFVDAIVGGAVPRQFIPAVEKGLREAIKKGVLAGYPMVNIKATLYDGKYHPVDSKEIRRISRRHSRRHEQTPRQNPRHRCRRGRQTGHHGGSSSGGNVPLRHRPPQHDPGQGQVLHGPHPLRRGSRQRQRQDYRGCQEARGRVQEVILEHSQKSLSPARKSGAFFALRTLQDARRLRPKGKKVTKQATEAAQTVRRRLRRTARRGCGLWRDEGNGKRQRKRCGDENRWGERRGEDKEKSAS